MLTTVTECDGFMATSNCTNEESRFAKRTSLTSSMKSKRTMSSRIFSWLIVALLFVFTVGCKPTVRAGATEKTDSRKSKIQTTEPTTESRSGSDNIDAKSDRGENSATDKKEESDTPKQPDQDKKEADKFENSTAGEKGEDEKQEKQLSPSEAEFQRRMQSLKKSVAEENRPERPAFNNRPKNRKAGSITFDDIKFQMEKGDKFSRKMLTEDINDLVGQRVSIKGYIRPNNKNKGLKKFVFVRDDKECCFGPGAALYDCVLVTLAKGKESDFTVRPITVEGEFYLKEFNGPDRRVWAVYRMKNCRVVQ